jgi:hypothetical protein
MPRTCSAPNVLHLNYIHTGHNLMQIRVASL